MKAYYESVSEKTMHLRAVVGANGNVIDRNYNPQHGKKGSLQSGDVGITVAIHGDTSNMTSAQAGAIQAMAVQMGGRVKERLGMKTQLGFAPGTVVEMMQVSFHGDAMKGVVEGQADGGLYVREFTNNLKATYRRYIPLAQHVVNEIPGRQGLEGLLLETLIPNLRERSVAFTESKFAQSLLVNEESWVELCWRVLPRLANERLPGEDACLELVLDHISQERLKRMLYEERHDKERAAILKRIKDQDQEWFKMFVSDVTDRARVDHHHTDVVRLKCAVIMRIRHVEFLRSLLEHSQLVAYSNAIKARLQDLAVERSERPEEQYWAD